MAPGPRAAQKSEKRKTREAKPRKVRKRKASTISRSHPLTISVTLVQPARLKKVSTKKAPAQARRPSSKFRRLEKRSFRAALYFSGGRSSSSVRGSRYSPRQRTAK